MSSSGSARDAEKLFTRAKTSAQLFECSASGLFKVIGADSIRYLHGRLTQNIKSLPFGAGARALILNPQGRVLGHLALVRRASDFLLVADAIPDDDARSSFVAALLQFKVSDDVQLESLAATHDLFAVYGPDATERVLQITTAAHDLEPYSGSEFHIGNELGFMVAVQAGALSGFTCIVPKGARNELLQKFESLNLRLGDRLANDDALEMVRITAGVPRYGAELTEKTSAADLPLDQLVSFNKGCYAGQEVVEMSHARGRPNRRLARFSTSLNDSIQAGDEITAANAERAGIITSVCHLPSENLTYGLGFIKSGFAENTILQVRDSVLINQD